MADDTRVACHVCGADALAAVDGFGALQRVTSDCRAWPPDGRLACCGRCGTAQKAVDGRWREEAERIYRVYDIYHQSGGAEQPAFDVGSGGAEPRSAMLVRALLAEWNCPATGRLLDIGCGNGALLRAFAAARPQWRLTGTELGERCRDAIEAIPGVEAFHAGPLAALDAAPFDAISMIHVLEHIEDPVAFLRALRARLAPGGVLVVEVPDAEKNPFDLLIADHCTHFSGASLRQVLARAGYRVLVESSAWVPKELSVAAVPAAAGEEAWQIPDAALAERVRGQVARLQALAERARSLAASGRRFGIFGTSIGGTWLDAEAGGRAAFFADEDANRAGRHYLKREVLLPRDVPAGASLLVPLAEPALGAVLRRLRGLRLELVAMV